MEMAAKVHPTKPIAIEKASPQHFREWQLEEEVPREQLDPPKRRAESIPRRMDEVFDWKNTSQYTDDRAKVYLILF